MMKRLVLCLRLAICLLLVNGMKSCLRRLLPAMFVFLVLAVVLGSRPKASGASQTSAGVPVGATSTTGSTTTGTTGTTGGTGGSGGGGTGSGVFTGLIYLQQLWETKAHPTLYRASSGVTPLVNQHASLVRVYLPSVTVLAPWELVGVDYNISALDSTVLAGRSDSSVAPIAQSSIPTSQTTTQAGITYVGVPAYGTFVCGLASSGPLSGGEIKLAIRKGVYTRKWNTTSGAWDYINSYEYSLVTLDLTKLSCSDASIDTRKGYGQPNLDGELPGDPNADLTNLNFANWHYKGGLFVGNMPAASGDLSGMARLQLLVPSGGQGDVRLATLSVFDLGSPTNASAPQIGLYLPSSSDPNLSTSQATLTWANKWTIEPRTSPSSPPDDSKDPISYVTFSGSGGDYANFPLNRENALPATMSLSKICLAMTVESESSGPFWRYFGSGEYQSAFSIFPSNDCAPRVWRVGEKAVTTWL